MCSSYVAATNRPQRPVLALFAPKHRENASNAGGRCSSGGRGRTAFVPLKPAHIRHFSSAALNRVASSVAVTRVFGAGGADRNTVKNCLTTPTQFRAFAGVRYENKAADGGNS